MQDIRLPNYPTNRPIQVHFSEPEVEPVQETVQSPKAARLTRSLRRFSQIMTAPIIIVPASPRPPREAKRQRTFTATTAKPAPVRAAVAPRVRRTAPAFSLKPFLTRMRAALRPQYLFFATQTALLLAIGFLVIRKEVVPQQTTLPIAQNRTVLPVIGERSDTALISNLASASESTKVAAWVAPWNAERVLGDAATGTYDSVNAFWGTLAADGFSIDAKAPWEQWTAIQAQYPDIETHLTVTADPTLFATVLANLDTQSKHIEALVGAAKTYGFDGIDLDYEALTLDQNVLFTAFAGRLSERLHAESLKLGITVETRINPEDAPLDWERIGQLADFINVMAYDYYGASTSEPGPVAPLGWVLENARVALQKVPTEKLTIGLGNYGYDWTQQADGSWRGIGLSSTRAEELAKSLSIAPVYASGVDARGYSLGSIPTYTYTDENSTTHVVWYDDARSLQDKVSSLKDAGISRIIFWSADLAVPTTSISGL
jgi:spore germination protein YaaH